MYTKAKTTLVAMLLGLLVVAQASAATPIRIATYASGVDPYERWERIAAAFHADRPDYVLDVEVISGAEYPTKVSLMLITGTAPDVFMTWGQYKAQWAERNFLMDLQPFWDRSEIAQNANVFSFAMEAAIYEGKIVGVPYDFSSRPLIVNRDAFNQAGISIPENDWTVEDFRNYAVRLTRPDDGFYGMGPMDNLANWIWSVNFTGNGWLNEDRTEVLVQDSGYIEFLEFWVDLINLGATPPPGRAASRSVWEGGYGMWTGWAHYGQNLVTATNYDWIMVPFPEGKAGNLHFAHGHMWSLPNRAENPELGWVFLEWLLSPEGQRAIVTLDSRQPLSNDPELWEYFLSNIPERTKRDSVFDLLIGTIYGENRIHTMQYWPTWPDIDRVMSQHVETVFRGLESPVSAMEKAATEIRAIISSN